MKPVRLDDPGQAQRLVEIERGQELMAPPEHGGVGHLAAFRGLRDRLAAIRPGPGQASDPGDASRPTASRSAG